eukprot:TRINITY_DN17527_c0_g1_i1.p2 TRINITY_DN17527_c0_g1~~TRINITY_DN17527_c0_g1_i1.p2  ORF type:complete len:172 (+),score=2.86 TRINITY_DN17527_c0_g1_i1:67-582(+)
MSLRRLLNGSIALQVTRQLNENACECSIWRPREVRWATKMQSGHTSNKKDTPGTRQGPKKTHGQYVRPGMILVRQQSLRMFAGWNVGMGSDRTIYSLIEGTVKYSWDQPSGRMYLNVNPLPHSLLPQLPATHQESEYVIGKLDPYLKKFYRPRKLRRRFMVKKQPPRRYGP